MFDSAVGKNVTKYSKVLDTMFQVKKETKALDENELDVEEDPDAWVEALKFMHRPDWCLNHTVKHSKYFKTMIPIAMRYEIVDLQAFCEDRLCVAFVQNYGIITFRR